MSQVIAGRMVPLLSMSPVFACQVATAAFAAGATTAMARSAWAITRRRPSRSSVSKRRLDALAGAALGDEALGQLSRFPFGGSQLLSWRPLAQRAFSIAAGGLADSTNFAARR
jgi:hypothetical protein